MAAEPNLIPSVPSNGDSALLQWTNLEVVALKSRVLALESGMVSLSQKLDDICERTAEVLTILKGAKTIGGFFYANWGKFATVLFAVATSQHWLNPAILAAIQSSFVPH